MVTAPGLPDTVRLGLVVGRRVGNAVERNRMKRRLRHAFADSTQRAGSDVVVIASREALGVPYADLVRWLDSASGRRGEEGAQEESVG